MGYRELIFCYMYLCPRLRLGTLRLQTAANLSIRQRSRMFRAQGGEMEMDGLIDIAKRCGDGDQRPGGLHGTLGLGQPPGAMGVGCP